MEAIYCGLICNLDVPEPTLSLRDVERYIGSIALYVRVRHFSDWKEVETGSLQVKIFSNFSKAPK